MGLQLIFVVETRKSCKSDWIYIKDTIDQFYGYENTKVKLTPVYMDGKGKYKNKEREIRNYRSQYAATTKNNRSEVIYCFDCDDYDSKPEDAAFLNNVRKYCNEKGYDFIWFYKDIEHVYLGKRIADKQKKAESAKFKSRKEIAGVEVGRLSAEDYQVKTSNILKVLNKYLPRK